MTQAFLLKSPEASTSRFPSPSTASAPPITSDIATLPMTNGQPDLRPRRKSLLQKILIRQAVEVHFAQTIEQPEPSVNCSGFSSSDDDDDDPADGEETDSVDDDEAMESDSTHDVNVTQGSATVNTEAYGPISITKQVLIFPFMKCTVCIEW